MDCSGKEWNEVTRSGFFFFLVRVGRSEMEWKGGGWSRQERENRIINIKVWECVRDNGRSGREWEGIGR